MIDYVLETTNEEQVNYIGHSNGALMLYVLLSEKPEYNAKITSFMALAPSVFIHTEYTMIFSLIPSWFFDTFFNSRVMMPKLSAHLCAVSEPLCKFVW